VVETATGAMFIAIGNDGQFRKMADLLGHPALGADPRFLTNGDRVRNRPALTAILAEIFAGVDRIALSERMLKAGLPAGPVMAVDEAMAAEHTAARSMVTELGAYRGLGTPIKMSRTPGGTRSQPPKFGEHTEGVLARHGYTAEEILALRASGAIADSRRKV
jgi:formyl-CoA transferase